jgi:hypothetical protein
MCWGNNGGINFNDNILSVHCSGNIYGDGFASNFLGPRCWNNTFGSNNTNMFVKILQSKDVSAVTGLQGKSYTLNIERRSDNTYLYRYLNNSNVPTYVPIA